MTMPIQFNRNQYVKILTDSGLPREHAAAHAAALTLALSQPVATDADMTIHRAELGAMLQEMEVRLEARLLAKLEEKMEEKLKVLEEKLTRKLRPIYAMGAVIVIMQTITMTKLFL